MSLRGQTAYDHPLLDAAAAGDVERMEQHLLLHPAAAAEARDGRGNTAAHAAARGGSVAALALLARREPGLLRAGNDVRGAPAHAAAEAGEVEVLRWLFEQVGGSLGRGVRVDGLIMDARMHACTHAWADRRMHACTHARTHARTHAQTDGRTDG